MNFREGGAGLIKAAWSVGHADPVMVNVCYRGRGADIEALLDGLDRRFIKFVFGGPQPCEGKGQVAHYFARPAYRDTARDLGERKGSGSKRGPQGSSVQSGLRYRAAAKAIMSSSDGEVVGAS
jgi:hypothetical protein